MTGRTTSDLGDSRRLARSYLFVPASRPERVGKARASGADVVIVDLEDAVAPDEKHRAREAIAAVLDPAHPVVARINAFGSPWFEPDLALCCSPAIAAIMVPKAEEPANLRAVHDACRRPVLPLIETARGVWNALEIARTTGVARLAFGAFDFRLDLGLPHAGYAQLAPYHARLVLASRIAGIAAPIDSPSAALNDESAVRAEALEGRNAGFGGKLCVHPSQVAAVNAAFMPSARELEWASRVVEATRAAGGAAVAVDGRMVDRPVLEIAERLLAQRRDA
jgi:citrate lyase subunit beta / citryl-CoA lyase